MFNILACEKPKHQEMFVEVEVGDIGLEEDAKLEVIPVGVIIDNKYIVDAALHIRPIW